MALAATPLTRDQANAHIIEHHRHHGRVSGHRFIVGALDGQALVGVAVAGRPRARLIDQYKHVEVNRLCSDGTKNVCSFLYSRAARIAEGMPRPGSCERCKAVKVLVCGGRDYDDWAKVCDVLGHLNPKGGNGITRILHGGATGADALGARWAIENDITCSTYVADWAKHGRVAGPIRNAEMLTKGQPDLVVAFPGGRGTADMVRRARAAGVQVVEVVSRSWQSSSAAGSK